MLGLMLPFPGAAWTRIQHFASFISNFGHRVTVLSIVTPNAVRNLKKTEKAENIDILRLLAISGVDSPLSIFVNAIFSFIFSSGT